jgi:hypothetical protein
MEQYKGLTKADRIVGGGTYVTETGTGFEVCNFAPVHGFHYAYVRPPRHGDAIKIDRLGAAREAGKVTGVTVIWTATKPGGGAVVVGWYLNATVFRRFQSFTAVPTPHRKNGIDGYWIRARATDAKLLPVDERTIEVPRGARGGMGNSNVWYADSQQGRSFVRRVLSRISGSPFGRHVNRVARAVDVDRKAKVERAAIVAVSKHYSGLGYDVSDVSRDNEGWDLVARSGRNELRIEVKGLSGSACRIELTPNEYRAFSALQPDYRLAIAISALDKLSLFICRYSAELRQWVVEFGPPPAQRVRFEKRTGASVWLT